MKKTLFFLILLSCFDALSQNLDGYFVSSNEDYNKYGKDYFKFDSSKKSYELLRMSNGERTYSKGLYKIDAIGNLILIINNWIKGSGIIIEQYERINKKSTYTFVIEDYKNNKLSSEIFIEDKAIGKTNELGQYSIQLDDLNVSKGAHFKIQSNGYNTEFLEIERSDADYHIYITMYSYKNQYKQGEHISYVIKNIIASNFILGIRNENVEFKSISPEEYSIIQSKFDWAIYQ